MCVGVFNTKFNFIPFVFHSFLQGDLDRQRLLGNRQRTEMSESRKDDGDCEGLEHQER